jgi:hypothetical protein
LWNALATRAVTWQVPAFFAVFELACVLAGRVVIRLAAPRGAVATDFATSFLIGFFLISTALLLLALLSPLGLVADSAVLLAVIVALAAPLSRETPRPRGGESVDFWCVMAVAISLAAATLWCQTSVSPVAAAGDDEIHKPWTDSYYHASQVRMFRDSHGMGSLQDFRVAGDPPLIYHYAGYLAPALLSSWTPTPAFLAFLGFMAPVGVFLTGLAAFALARSFWGERAGLGATAALLLLPDASAYGWGNRWLSYHWLQIISPTGAIGVSVLAISWIFMIEGCRRGRFRLIACSYLVAFFSIQFKAQIFIANAFLLWVYPALFLRGLSRGRRIAWFTLSSLVFFSVVGISQRFERVPLMRPGRSAARTYMSLVFQQARGFQRTELVQSWFPGSFRPESPWLGDLGTGAVLLFLGTFGLLGLTCLLIASSRRVRMRMDIRVLPLMVMANYLAMALLLLPDNRAVANPEELQHRTLVWAYFVVATWVGGVAGRRLLRGRRWRSWPWRAGLALAALALLAIPLSLGRDAQRGPEFGYGFTRQAVPRGLVDCCSFLREHAGLKEFVQDSENDPKLHVVGLSERQPLAIYHLTLKPRPSLQHHLAELETLRRLDNEADVRELAARNNLAWYLLRPEGRVAWPASILDHPAFESHGYRVYHLIDGGLARISTALSSTSAPNHASRGPGPATAGRVAAPPEVAHPPRGRGVIDQESRS